MYKISIYWYNIDVSASLQLNSILISVNAAVKTDVCVIALKDQVFAKGPATIKELKQCITDEINAESTFPFQYIHNI